MSDAGGWVWALFAIRGTDVIPAARGSAAEFYGSAGNETAALDALKARWQQWLVDAELVCTMPAAPGLINS